MRKDVKLGRKHFHLRAVTASPKTGLIGMIRDFLRPTLGILTKNLLNELKASTKSQFLHQTLIPRRSDDSGVSKGSIAMEQLDFERGFCIPFRKYTPGYNEELV